eukprot:gene2970-1952_t
MVTARTLRDHVCQLFLPDCILELSCDCWYRIGRLCVVCWLWVVRLTLGVYLFLTAFCGFICECLLTDGVHMIHLFAEFWVYAPIKITAGARGFRRVYWFAGVNCWLGYLGCFLGWVMLFTLLGVLGFVGADFADRSARTLPVVAITVLLRVLVWAASSETHWGFVFVFAVIALLLMWGLGALKR